MIALRDKVLSLVVKTSENVALTIALWKNVKHKKRIWGSFQRKCRGQRPGGAEGVDDLSTMNGERCGRKNWEGRGKRWRW